MPEAVHSLVDSPMPASRWMIWICIVLGIAALIAYFSLPPNFIAMLSAEPITLTQESSPVLPQTVATSIRYARPANYTYGRQNDRYVLLYPDTQLGAQKVTGELPMMALSRPLKLPDGSTLTETLDLGFHNFVTLTLPTSITTYATYLRREGATIEGLPTDSTELYVLNGASSERLLSHIAPGGLLPLDGGALLQDAYMDKLGTLYTLTLEGVLCAVRDGKVMGKVDISGLLEKNPDNPPIIFSDSTNAYLVFPKPNAPLKITLKHLLDANAIASEYKIGF